MTASSELETFGRRLGETQGFRGSEPVDWVRYGAAARRALGRGVGVPLVAAFLRSEAESNATDHATARFERWNPSPHARQIFSLAWTARCAYAITWRVTVLLAVTLVLRRGFVPTGLQLLVGAAVVLVPGVWPPWRRMWRWLALSLLLAYGLSFTRLFPAALALAIALSFPAGILSARRWRLGLSHERWRARSLLLHYRMAHWGRK